MLHCLDQVIPIIEQFLDATAAAAAVKSASR
jgi:hypothetical protein